MDMTYDASWRRRGQGGRFVRLCSLVLLVLLGFSMLSRSPSLYRPVQAAGIHSSNNPILPLHRADPHVAYFAGRYWIYPTAEDGQRFKAYSSADLVSWVDEGVVLDLGPGVSWADTNGWAPAVAFRNNQYYFYFSAGGVGGGQNSKIGVAVGSSPRGPFVDRGAPLVASKTTSPLVEAIDAHVFIDTDGQTYMYYGGSWGANLAIQRLNSDMVTLSGSASIVTPQNFTEGAFMLKRNGVYYMSYSNGVWSNDTYNLQYATSSSPLGPWTYRGQILSSDATRKGPGHHAIVQVPNTDSWRIVYHYWDSIFSARHVAVDQLRFSADGSMQRVAMTSGGGAPIQRWEASSVAGSFIRHSFGRGRIDPNVAPLEDSQFYMVPGLASSAAVSFQSVNFPNAFLRHRNGELWLDTNDGSALFKADATFHRRPGLANSSQISFESYNIPGSYIRQRGGLLHNEALSSSSPALDRAEATWIGHAQVVRWEASNVAGSFMRHSFGRGRVDPNVAPVQDSQFYMVPGLSNPAAVTFQSVNFPGSYLRHRNGEVWLDTYDGTALFRDDATFYRRAGLSDAGLTSFESFNIPGNYLRHRGGLLYSEPAVTAQELSDATFRQVLVGSAAAPPLPSTVPPTATRTSTTGVATATRTRTNTPVGATATRTSTSAPGTCGTANIAQGKPATSSSNENTTLTPNLAVDGNTTTRWASAFADPQWIQVDLGVSTAICRVTLNWEAAYGSAYQLLSSNDAVTWSTVKSVTGENGGIDDHTGLNVSARYLRINGTTRATTYGYSLWEISIYSGSAAPTPTRTSTSGTAPTATRTRTSTSGTAPTATRTRTNTSGTAPTATRTRTNTTVAATATRTATTSGVAAWAPGTSYAVGATVSYGGRNYRCLQAHTSQVGWEPPSAPALWQAI